MVIQMFALYGITYTPHQEGLQHVQHSNHLQEMQVRNKCDRL
jgi:hypothetical protein